MATKAINSAASALQKKLKLGPSSKSVDSSDQDCHIPCLGRPVALGTLYDARSDRFITGMKLWSPETMLNMTTSKVDPKQSISFETDSTFAEKANLLGLSPALKLSFLCGNIKAEGSAQYLSDSKTSLSSERLTLAYTVLTKFEELNLGPPVEHPQLLKDKSATHVVTGLRFGAKAFLVFEKEKKEHEKSEEVAEALERAVTDLKSALHQTSEKDQPPPQYSDSNGNSSDYGAIKCRYFGDFDIEPPPMTLKEAFGCVGGLGSDNAETPLEVYLTPVSQLGGKASIQARKISDELLNDAGDYCQVLNDVISATSACIKQLTPTPWQHQRASLFEFVKLVETMKTRYSEKLLKLLPEARDSSSKCEKIAKLLSSFRDKSPFSPHQLRKWITSRERECAILLACGCTLSSAGVQLLRDAADKHLLDSQTEQRLLVEVRFAESQFPKNLKQFLESKKTPASSKDNTELDQCGETWIDSADHGKFNEVMSDVVRSLMRSSGAAASPGSVALISGTNELDGSRIHIRKLYKKGHQWSPLVLPSPPKNISCTAAKATAAKLSWSPVTCDFCPTVQYQVELFHTDRDSSKPCRTELTDVAEIEISSLSPSTEFNVRIATLTPFGDSKPSSASKFRTLTATFCSEYVKEKMCEPMPLRKEEGEKFQGEIYLLKKQRMAPPEGCRCPGECLCPISFEVGDNRTTVNSAKYLLVVGETGTGKSTFVNGIANAFYKVKYNENFRLKLIAEPECHPGGDQAAAAVSNQAHSQTSTVAVYTLFPVDAGGGGKEFMSAMDCPLTIIDTPGFGDTRGLAEDEKVVKKISKVLGEDGAVVPGMSGILHAIGFVVKASQNRLTVPQKYIFDQVLSLFGKDVGKIIFPILTFADSNDPQALAALREDNVPHERCLKFNNGMLYADNSDFDSLKQNLAVTRAEMKKIEMRLKANVLDWDQGELNYLDLFDVMNEMTEGTSLQTTRDVLKNRKTLELCMESLKRHVDTGITMLTSLEVNLNLIDSLDVVIKDADMRKTRKTMIPKTRRCPVPHDAFVTLCMVCSKTCHDYCVYSKDDDKKLCLAIDASGHCTVCPKNCFWDQHCNKDYYYEEYEEEETVTVKEIAEKYKVNTRDRDAKKQLIQGLLDDFERTYADLSYNLVTIHKCLQSLEQLALRQYPMSVVEYVDNLIRVQETQKKPGWENRVRHLEGARESAKIVAAARDGQDPFGEMKEKVLARCKNALEAEFKSKSLLSRFVEFFTI